MTLIMILLSITLLPVAVRIIATVGAGMVILVIRNRNLVALLITAIIITIIVAHL